jgi:Asp-tRNA(Asn)/Glu-tRNA(Gln) amidotransferase A subunit family amidase
VAPAVHAADSAIHPQRVAIGTEPWGSIVCPAGADDVVGVKPMVDW